jgi:AraC-like DNA-binding protein
LLQARTGDTRDMLARPVKPVTAESSLASAFLEMLPTRVGKLRAAAEEIIKDQVLDLIAVSLAKAIEGDKPRVSSARSLVLLNVRAAIEARLADPALDAATVAAAAGVSIRYANAVLAGEGMSITRLIQSRRLARCRQALANPLQQHRTIGEIAYGWGFSDMTHFGRRFKAAYNLSPSDFRSHCRQPASNDRAGQIAKPVTPGGG